ncbi:S16 family serine protease [Paenibacillus chungangensis]|uniref:S16 family serine protease n=1 Tax=Paenibacillus chungangensis TaxID=696535 RepID=A0ABW3HPP9_9BACL
MKGRSSVLRRTLISAACAAVIMWGLLYAPTPYVVYEPGIAIPVASLMERGGISAEVGGGEEGLLLTAVKLSAPNMWEVAKAVIHRDKEVAWKRDVFSGGSQRQFAERLTVIMQGSQNDALEAAYRNLGVGYRKEPQSLVVSDVQRIAGQPASGFRAGDVIIGVHDGEGISGADEAVTVLRQHQGKESLTLDVRGTDGKKRVVRIPLPESGTSSLTLEQLPIILGVTGFIELRAIVAEEASQQLAITANGIGGPSAGLVFALQGINLLTEEKLADDIRIAATGTIAPDGKVGAIGGVRQKVVSTSLQGAELFLVPKDNEREARRKSKAIGSEMKIVGISTLEEALAAIADYRRTAAR